MRKRAEKVPQSLTRLSLVFAINEPSKKLDEKVLQSPTRLRLDFHRNSNFTDESLKKLAERCRKVLRV